MGGGGDVIVVDSDTDHVMVWGSGPGSPAEFRDVREETDVGVRAAELVGGHDRNTPVLEGAVVGGGGVSVQDGHAARASTAALHTSDWRPGGVGMGYLDSDSDSSQEIPGLISSRPVRVAPPPPPRAQSPPRVLARDRLPLQTHHTMVEDSCNVGVGEPSAVSACHSGAHVESSAMGEEEDDNVVIYDTYYDGGEAAPARPHYAQSFDIFESSQPSQS